MWKKMMLLAIVAFFLAVPMTRAVTVQLQDADTENLADAHVWQAANTTNYGTSNNLYIRDHTTLAYRTYFMFDISSLPTSISISESKLCLYEIQDSGSGTISIYHVNDTTWNTTNETTLTWNNQPCGTNFDDTTRCNTTAENGTNGGVNAWQIWIATQMVSRSYTNGDKNVSMVLKTAESSSYSNEIYASKEYTTSASKRPYLNVTYTYQSEPMWYVNQSATQAYYNPNIQSYNFNMTWNTTGSSISNISTVYIEHNLTGTSTNYSMTNVTYGGNIFNYTYNSIVGMGTYYWKSYANETLNDYFNGTDTWYFTMAKNATNPVHLTINNGTDYQDQNVSAGSATSITMTCAMNYTSSGDCDIWVDGAWQDSPYTNTFGVGTKTILVNTSGNANYTSNATGATFYLTISLPEGGELGGGGPGATPTEYIIQNVETPDIPSIPIDKIIVAQIALGIIVTGLGMMIYNNSVARKRRKREEMFS